MKRIFALAVLCMAITGFAAAGGLVFHAGAGYHSSYIGMLPTNVDDSIETLKAMPLGVGGYVGLGYGFGEKKVFSLGVEAAPAWDLALQPIAVSNFSIQGRGFLKLKPMDILTLTAFVGWGGNLATAKDINSLLTSNLVLGGRITALFLYAEYGAVMQQDFSGILRHEIGLGFAIFK
ncbi:MAG: hypothetical protein MI717_13530 [Spirochaetales bacterium]|nr:hypothetical protein [Spirochaetales bacterium]